MPLWIPAYAGMTTGGAAGFEPPMIRIFRHYIPKSLIILGASEAFILFTSIYLGVTVRIFDFNPTDKLLVGDIWTKALLYTTVMMFLMATMGLYQRGPRDDLRGVLFRVGVAFLLGLLVMAAVITLAPPLSTGSAAFTVSFVTSSVGIMVFRVLIRQYTEHDIFKRHILVLGTGKLARQVEELRRRTDWRDTVLVGFVHVRGERDTLEQERVLHIKTSLLHLAIEHRVNEIIVAVEERRAHFPVNEILDCKMSGIQVVDMVTFFEKQTGKLKLDALSPSAMIFSDGFIQAVLKGYIHRGFDMCVSLFILLLAWPVMLVAALAIFLESGGSGPIFYRQVRVGRNGRRFSILKFRSMSVGAEKDGAQWAKEQDARVTRVGGLIRKTRIDELPQLINVFRGDMSFVGPRPERPEFVTELEEQIPYYELRHRVNPGITGWAQICYPYGASAQDAKEKLQYDLYYIKNYSIFLDITILIQTAQVILWGQGAR